MDNTQDFLNWLTTTGLNFYRTSQNQSPVITGSSGQIVGTAESQTALYFMVIVAALVLLLLLFRK